LPDIQIYPFLEAVETDQKIARSRNMQSTKLTKINSPVPEQHTLEQVEHTLNSSPSEVFAGNGFGSNPKFANTVGLKTDFTRTAERRN